MQVIDPAWSAKAMLEWFNTGANVRMSHNPQRPIGKGISCETDNTGRTHVRTLVVDKQAKKLVRAGVLRAYSVGVSNPRVERDTTGKAVGGIIRGGQVVELTLCDRPSNPSCGIRMVKSADGFTVKSFGMNMPKEVRKAMKATSAPTRAEKQAAAVIAKQLAQNKWHLLGLLNHPDPWVRETARDELGKLTG